MPSLKFCPRVTGVKGSPTIEEIECSQCGNKVEFFSNDIEVKCDNCESLIKLA